MKISTIVKRYKKNDTKSIEIIESQRAGFRVIITNKVSEQEIFVKTIEIDVPGFQIEKFFGHSKIEMRKYLSHYFISIKFDVLNQIIILK